MPAVDFLMYTTGTSVVIVAVAWALRLLGFRFGSRVAPAVKQGEQSTPDEVGLSQRLREFQEARFASPIVQGLAQRRPPVLPERRPIVPRHQRTIAKDRK